MSAYRSLLLGLYKQQLRAANKFNTWNFREYFKVKARDDFLAIKNETNVDKVKEFVEKVRREDRASVSIAPTLRYPLSINVRPSFPFKLFFFIIKWLLGVLNAP